MSGQNVRGTTAEIVVGLVVAIVSVLFFLDISILVKMALVTFLGIVGLLDFLALTGQTQKWGWKWRDWKRQRRLLKRPDLEQELFRLNLRINETLYGRNTGKFSLALQGVEVMETLGKVSDISRTLYDEFFEKFSMAQTFYAQIYHKISSRQNRHWKSDDFAETMRAVSSHLGMLNLVFKSAYRLIDAHAKLGMFPSEALEKWQGFAKEYNRVLDAWKAFTERFDQSIGYGTATQAEYVREIP